MEQRNLQILVCEDDESLGKGIVESFVQLGYQATLVGTASEAKKSIKSGQFQCCIIDCMLPDQNGIDLAKSLRLICGKNLKIIFISGLFINDKFIEQAIHSTQAVNYLTKPFVFDELLKVFLQAVSSSGESLGLLHGLSEKEKIKEAGLRRESQIRYGFEIPFLLTEATIRGMSGLIKLQSKKLKIDGAIHLNKGRIFSVQSNRCKESRLGQVLKEKGFIPERELRKRLKEKPEQFLGEYLIQNNSISPHSLNIVLLEQMKRRLDQFIQDESYMVSIVEEENLPSDVYIDSITFNQLLDGWVKTKLSLDWIREQLEALSQYTFSFKKETSLEELFDEDLCSQLRDLSQGEVVFSEVLSLVKKSSEKGFVALYTMILLNQISFQQTEKGKEGAEGNSELQINRLKELYALYEKQNHYERLGLEVSSRVEDVQAAFGSISEDLDYTDPYKNYSKELMLLSREVLLLLEESQRVLGNMDLRSAYTAELIGHSSSKEVVADMSYGYSWLLSEKYEQALNIFSRMPKVQEYYEKWGLYLLWAEIKCNEGRDNASFIEYVGKELLKLPVPQDPVRHAHYHIVKALYHIICKKYKLAERCLEHAGRVDSSGSEIVQKELHKVRTVLKGEKESRSSALTQKVVSFIEKKLS